MHNYILINGTLYHHGIKGQKWGERNGPPYPLKEEDHSKAEIDAKKKKIKKALLISAGIGVTALTIGYLYKKGYISAGKEYIENAVGGFINKDLSKLSDDEKQKLINPKFGQSLEYMMNCGNCAIADDAQQRGIDVVARGNSTGMTIGDLISHYKNMPSSNVLIPDANDLHDIGNIPKSFDEYLNRGGKVYNLLKNKVLSSFPDNSRGSVFVPNINGSHWMTWKVENGQFKIRNTQNPSLVSSIKNINMYLGGYKYHANYPDAQLTIIRTDNVDFDHLYDAVKRRNIGLNTKDYDTWKVIGKNFIIKNFERE